jgi:hypothetical protein
MTVSRHFKNDLTKHHPDNDRQENEERDERRQEAELPKR